MKIGHLKTLHIGESALDMYFQVLRCVYVYFYFYYYVTILIQIQPKDFSPHVLFYFAYSVIIDVIK